MFYIYTYIEGKPCFPTSLTHSHTFICRTAMKSTLIGAVFHGRVVRESPILGPPKIARPFGALPLSYQWSDDEEEEDELAMGGHYYQLGDEVKDFMFVEEVVEERRRKMRNKFLPNFRACFSFFNRLFLGASSSSSS